MIIVLYENVANIILPFMDSISEKYPKSSRGILNRRDKVGDVAAKFSKPPLFNSGWLIECDSGAAVSAIEKTQEINANNVVVIRVTNQKALQNVRERLAKVDYRFVDNYRLTQTEIINWVQKELGCSFVVADLVYERTKGKIQDVIAAVGVLSVIDRLAPEDVRRYVEKSNRFGVHDLLLWLVGAPPRGMKQTDAIKIVYNYRFAIDWLMKYLIQSVNTYIVVFNYAIHGDLSLLNYQEFRKISNDKHISDVTEYQLKKILELFGKISLEYLFYIGTLMSTFDTKSQITCYKIIQLIKLGGSYA